MNRTVVIFGANGFLGRYLCRHLTREGYEIVAIARSRNGWSGDGMFLEWDGKALGPWALALEGAHTVINLAGSSVNCSYNARNRERIMSSRIDSTRVIGEAIRECKVPPKLWMNAATATWYRHAEDRPQDEWMGEHGSGFSCEVARRWEEEFFQSRAPAVTRKVALRIGMVMAHEPETVYSVLKSLTQRGLGGKMGDGNQRVSWIHMEDFLRAVDFVINNALLEGVINVTSPEVPTNRELMACFRKTTGIPFGLPAPPWALRIGALVMRTETELVLKSRWAAPVRLHDAGFRWHHSGIASAITDLEARPGLDGFFKSNYHRSVGARAWVPALRR